MDPDTPEGELEVVDGAHDGGVEPLGQHLGGKRVWGLDDKDAAAPSESHGIGVHDVGPGVGFGDFARQRALCFSPHFF